MSVRIPETQRVRAQLDGLQKTGVMSDQITGAAAVFFRGSPLRFEFGLFYGEDIADPSVITTARLRILTTTGRDTAVAMDKTIGITSMKPGLTLAEWQAGGLADCHLAFEFSGAECAESVFGGALADEAQHWFQLTYGATDVTWFGGTLTSLDAGYDAAGNAPPASPTNVSREEVATMIAALGQQFVKFNGNPPGAAVVLTSEAGKLVRLKANDQGDLDIGTQTTT